MDEATLTIFTSHGVNLHKSFKRNNGEIEKSAIAYMSKGTYSTVTCLGPEKLNDVLNNLKQNQAVAIGKCM